jgi:hypothetical protein
VAVGATGACEGPGCPKAPRPWRCLNAVYERLPSGAERTRRAVRHTRAAGRLGRRPGVAPGERETIGADLTGRAAVALRAARRLRCRFRGGKTAGAGAARRVRRAARLVQTARPTGAAVTVRAAGRWCRRAGCTPRLSRVFGQVECQGSPGHGQPDQEGSGDVDLGTHRSSPSVKDGRLKQRGRPAPLNTAKRTQRHEAAVSGGGRRGQLLGQPR